MQQKDLKRNQKKREEKDNMRKIFVILFVLYTTLSLYAIDEIKVKNERTGEIINALGDKYGRIYVKPYNDDVSPIYIYMI